MHLSPLGVCRWVVHLGDMQWAYKSVLQHQDVLPAVGSPPALGLPAWRDWHLFGGSPGFPP